MTDVLRCKHCGERIVWQGNFVGMEGYTHQPAGASFMDGQHIYCHLTSASPDDASPKGRKDTP